MEKGAPPLFNGSTYTVRNPRETAQLRGRLKPGDTVVFAGGEWRDAAVRLRASGTAAHPILFRAQSPATVFTGTSSAAFMGANLVVQGLTFRRGRVSRDEFTVFRLGDGDANPCDRCIADHIAIDDYNSAPGGYDTRKVFYVVLHGRDITVANSSFTAKKNLGTMISADLPAAGAQRLLFVKNFVSGFGAAREDRSGNHKLIQLGASEVSTRSAFAAILGNVFERATGENETISLKASDVIVRGNLFRANRGTLNLRSANRVLVENNIFDGAGTASMGGVRISGRGHWIVRNRFANLVKPMDDYYWPIAIHTAHDAELRDNAEDYAQARDVVIAGNRFDNDNLPPIIMGIYPDAAVGRTLMPKDIYLLGNRFAGPGPIFYVGGRQLYPRIFLRGNTE